MSSVGPDGFQCDDLATIFDRLTQAMVSIFGTDLILDPSSIDGQTIAIFAEAKADSDQLALDVYNSWNPQTAVGVALSRLVEFNGIRRIPSEPSQLTITCGGTVGSHIPIGSVVSSPATGAQFVTIQDAVISDSGEIDVACLSQQYGAIQCPATTRVSPLNIVTPQFGWQYAYNRYSAILGRDLETDEQLRMRRAASVATPAQAIPESLYGAVANIPLVTQVRLYENYEETTDPVTGLPPHSYCLIVLGGDDVDIASQIWLRASLGATQVGNTTVTISDIQGFPHDITFQRPLLVRIYMSITLRALTGWQDAMKLEMAKNIAQWAVENWLIGDAIIYSRIYQAINELPNVFSITSLRVDTISPPVNMFDIQLPFASLPVLAPADISVTVGTGIITPPPPPLALPTITSVSPNFGVTQGGTNVTIAGTGFAAGETVMFGGVGAGNVVVVNSTTITAITPPNPAGPVTVSVSLAGQTIGLANAFIYGTAPTVTGINPSIGPVSGGTSVIINGSNFVVGATVMIGSALATNVVVLGTGTITANTPAGTAGAHNVTVTNPNGISASLVNAFTYSSAPTITSIDPTVGTSSGGFWLTITGTNFDSGAGVMIGPYQFSPDSVVWESPTTILVHMGMFTPGIYSITVGNPDNQTATLLNAFTYV